MANKRISHYLTHEEIARIKKVHNLKSTQGRRDLAIILLLLNTGLRQAELRSLNVSDFKIEGEFVTFIIKGKGGYKDRVFLKDPVTWSQLQTYWQKAGVLDSPVSPAFLTHGKQGGHKVRRLTAEAIRGIIRRACSRAEIEKRITPHSLRHTFLTHMLQYGVDVRTVQALARHRSLTSTTVYLHTDEKLIKEAVSKFTL